MGDRVQGEWVASRAEGVRRIAAFAPRMGRQYAARRNYDLGVGDRGNVSVLSPYLSHRLVTEDEAIRAALALHGPQGAEKFIQEVCWRSYWKGWLEMRPGVWAGYLADLARERERAAVGGEAAERLARAEAGATGIAAFDAWAAELAATGWLHNHARMWAASIWIFTLRLPWVLGADWFARHLVDADAAANTCSWRWVAGLHTPGKHYVARADNIATYTAGRLAAPGLALAPLPLEEGPFPPRGPIRAASPPRWEAPTAVILTAEDLCLETMVPLDRAVAVATLDLGATRPRGAVAAAFARGALADAAARAGAAGAVALAPDPGAVADWARAMGAARIATGFAHVGWARDWWQAAAPALARAGLALDEARRPWDDRIQPLATAGFFKLKERLPGLLRDLG